MAYTGDIRIQGLHVVNVLQAARALIAANVAQGNVAQTLVPQLMAELLDLQEAVDRLSQFEREAKTRGTLKHTTDADDLARALDAARGLLDMTAAQRDALNASPEEDAEAFSLDEPEPTPEPGAPIEVPGDPDDPFNMQ